MKHNLQNTRVRQRDEKKTSQRVSAGKNENKRKDLPQQPWGLAEFNLTFGKVNTTKLT